MIQLVAYMIVAYGIARLVQTTIEATNGTAQLFGFIGIAALAGLAILVTQQANEISGLTAGF